MDSLLDALQEGRLIELPDNDKFDSLQFLAHIIEAIPSVPNGTDVEGLVLAREKNTNTALGKGFACPHARVPYDEDLICSVGWSPTGIDYGAPDNIPVHIIIMYLVPDNQRNHYLKEISLLAKALQKNSNIELLRTAKDLNVVRNYLLDLVSSSKDMVGFEARARMIQLETRDTQAQQKIKQLSDVLIEPVTIVYGLNQRPIVLCQNKELVELLDKSTQLIESINTKGFYEQNGWRIIKRNSSDYQANRSMLECIAVKLVVKN
ncbi:PTS sugar transporter subunit IIA [Melioribacteraceae bacterium 4301-Me]|uniref:PTS sugar transporter subunit IIA n=1 Tax=Pyranulibacter aquaticus TaxID=3163344 RepID=UPI003598BC7D